MGGLILDPLHPQRQPLPLPPWVACKGSHIRDIKMVSPFSILYALISIAIRAFITSCFSKSYLIIL